MLSARDAEQFEMLINLAPRRGAQKVARGKRASARPLERRQWHCAPAGREETFGRVMVSRPAGAPSYPIDTRGCAPR